MRWGRARGAGGARKKSASAPARCQPRITRDSLSSSPFSVSPGPGQAPPGFSPWRISITRCGAMSPSWTPCRLRGSVQLGAKLLPQQIDGHQLALDLKIPELPAIAGGSTLDMGADLVDRAAAIGGDQRAVGAHLGGPAPVGAGEQRAGREIAALHEPAEGNAGLVALRGGGDDFEIGVGRSRAEALLGDGDIALVALDADIVAAEPLGDDAGGAGAEEGIEDEIARLGRSEDDAVKERLGLLGRMGLLSVPVLQPLAAIADRKQPVAAHLEIVVERFHRLVVEAVARLAILGAPDHRLMGVGETPPAEVRHRIRLAPDDIVQNPVAEILEPG